MRRCVTERLRPRPRVRQGRRGHARLLPGFARYREYAEGSISEKGLANHLVLLSVYQSCEYQGVSFLRFLKSGMRDLGAFRERGKPGRGQGLPAIQLYPKGFTPPHILRSAKKKVGKDATQGEAAAPQSRLEPEPSKPTHTENSSTADE